MMRSACYAMLAVAAFAAGLHGRALAAEAGDEFDGRWVALVPAAPSCSAARLTLDVKEGSIIGNIENKEGVFPVAGSVGASGAGTLRIGQVAGVIRFDEDRFEADYPNLRCGPRHAAGRRID